VPLAHVDHWTGRDVRLAEVERALAELRERDAHDADGPDLRTSVLTHLAWVPESWRAAVEEVLLGLDERHPSRAVILYPLPESPQSRLDAEISLEAYDLKGQRRHVSAEVVRLELHGARADAPGSVVAPLLVPDLPVFLRWRGEPAFGSRPLEQLLCVADRLVVDSTEWDDPAAGYARLTGIFDRTAVSDIAWSRTLRWRRALADLWPGIADVRELRVHAPEALALLLAGWLRSRLDAEIHLVHEPAEQLTEIALDGVSVQAPPGEPRTPSDLLSDELEVYGRDRIYEEAVRCAAEGSGVALRGTGNT